MSQIKIEDSDTIDDYINNILNAPPDLQTTMVVAVQYLIIKTLVPDVEMRTELFSRATVEWKRVVDQTLLETADAKRGN